MRLKNMMQLNKMPLRNPPRCTIHIELKKKIPTGQGGDYDVFSFYLLRPSFFLYPVPKCSRKCKPTSSLTQLQLFPSNGLSPYGLSFVFSEKEN